MTVLPRSGVKDRARERKAAQMENLDVLDAIQARADKATPGPWAKGAKASGLNENLVLFGPRFTDPFAVVHGDRDRALNGQDAAFIAAAREDIPRLVRALRAALAGLRCEYEPDGTCGKGWTPPTCPPCAARAAALAELGDGPKGGRPKRGER
jgi:hypothetical protein